jgi:MFS family permease
MMESYLDLSKSEFQYFLYSLISIYAGPSVVVPLISGLLADHFGDYKVAFVFSIFHMIGQAVYAMGLTFKLTGLMLLGRLITGLIGESMDTLNSIFISTWISPHLHGKAFGINSAYEKLIMAISDITSPIVGKHSVVLATWISLIACTISLCSASVYIWINGKYAKPIFRDDDEEVEFKQAKISPKLPWYKSIIYDLKSLPAKFYLLFLVHFIYYSTFDPYFSQFFEQKYFKNDLEMVGFFLGLPSLISVFALPAIGLFIDRFQSNRKPLFLILGLAIETTARYIFVFDLVSPIYPVVMRGISSSMVLCIAYSQVPEIVPSNHLGTAFGLMTVSQTLSQVVFPIFSAQLLQMSGSFDSIQLYLAILVSISLLLSVYYYSLGHKLYLTSNESTSSIAT